MSNKGDVINSAGPMLRSSESRTIRSGADATDPGWIWRCRSAVGLFTSLTNMPEEQAQHRLAAIIAAEVMRAGFLVELSRRLKAAPYAIEF